MTDQVKSARVKVACVVEVDVPLVAGEDTPLVDIVEAAKTEAEGVLSGPCLRVTGSNVVHLEMEMLG